MKYFIGLLSALILNDASFAAVKSEDTYLSQKARVETVKQAINEFNSEHHRNRSSGPGRFYVGADSACDYTSIQSAINATIGNPFAPEVFIASNMTYEENLIINDVSLYMDGGFSNCADARNGIRGGSRAKITGDVSSSQALVTVLIGSHFVSIKDIQMHDTNSKGVRVLNSSSTVKLEGMLFFQLSDNAVQVEGSGSPNVMIEDTIFLQNSAVDGGTINCSGTNNLVVMDDSAIANSTATGDGGAVYLAGACDFTMMNGSAIDGSRANGNGGGIYAEFGSDVVIEQSILSRNSADGSGGAVYAQDGATTVTATAAQFNRNESLANGGAIAAVAGASFDIERTEVACNDEGRCNFFDDNNANGNGGAIYNNDGTVNIQHTYFEENRADFGTAIYSTGSTANTVVGQSIFNNNGDNGNDGFLDTYVLRAIAGAKYDVNYSTFADNHVEGSVFGIFNQASTQITLNNSIVHDIDSGDVLNNSPGTATFNCVIVHESISISGTQIMVEDPEFVDRNNRDYHLNAVLSPAVDVCIDGTDGLFDIDMEPRGFDDPLVANPANNPNARYDVGADEAQSDLIFINGFE